MSNTSNLPEDEPRPGAVSNDHRGTPPVGWVRPPVAGGPGPDEVVDLIPFEPGSDGSVRVPPTSAAERAARRLRHLAVDGSVCLPESTIARIAQSVLDPAALAVAVPSSLRTDDGWLSVINTRVMTPLLNVAVANDRLLGEVVYAADPTSNDSGGNIVAVSMPRSDEQYARLAFDEDIASLMEAADRSCEHVALENPQEVGPRLIERPLTIVPVVLQPGDDEVEMLCAVDGNSRLAAAFRQITVRREWLPAHLRGSDPEVRLEPSLLMNLDLAEQRDLTRRIANAASTRLTQPAATGSERVRRVDRQERNQAAATLNSITAPADIIVGFRPDQPGHGNADFASAVRGLLVRMNVGVTPFSDDAKFAVTAEEIVLALHAEGLIGDADRDALIGRHNVDEAMVAVGLDPGLPDLRFAFVVHHLTRGNEPTRRILRKKLGKTSVQPRDRSGPVTELGLRSYSARLMPRDLTQVRRALDGCVWDKLVTQPWKVVNIVTDDDVDALAAYAHDERLADGSGPSLLLLGVLGLIALTTSQHLLAPRGSAEALVNAPIDRAVTGGIVEKLLKFDWGVDMLAEAIKATRRGDEPVWVGPPSADGTPVDTSSWTGAMFDASLRQAVHAGRTPTPVTTPSAKEAQAWSDVQQAVVRVTELFEEFAELRAVHNTTTPLGEPVTEATRLQLRNLEFEITRIS